MPAEGNRQAFVLAVYAVTQRFWFAAIIGAIKTFVAMGA
jgi:hypothetical protein